MGFQILLKIPLLKHLLLKKKGDLKHDLEWDFKNLLSEKHGSRLESLGIYKVLIYLQTTILKTSLKIHFYKIESQISKSVDFENSLWG